MRLIDADAFKEYIRGACEEMSHVYKDGGKWAKQITEDFCMDIDDQPTIEPEPKKGKWIKARYVLASDPVQYVWNCSECGKSVSGRSAMVLTDFCPNCGADMRGDQNED